MWLHIMRTRNCAGAVFATIYSCCSVSRLRRSFWRRGYWFASTLPSAFFPAALRKLFARSFELSIAANCARLTICFLPRYRGEVSFDTWHQLFIRHWRMFHADVERAEPPWQSGPGVTLEIYLHGSDDREYRARFTLIHTDGRWWIDDVHWTQEPDEGAFTRI